jgi:hypothetical protein
MRAHPPVWGVRSTTKADLSVSRKGRLARTAPRQFSLFLRFWKISLAVGAKRVGTFPERHPYLNGSKMKPSPKNFPIPIRLKTIVRRSVCICCSIGTTRAVDIHRDGTGTLWSGMNSRGKDVWGKCGNPSAVAGHARQVKGNRVGKLRAAEAPSLGKPSEHWVPLRPLLPLRYTL